MKHFSSKEATRRDKILINYFGEKSLNRIADKIVEFLFASPTLPADAKVPDVGAGSGFFTIKVTEKVRNMTPAMLLSLMKKGVDVQPFIGLAENLESSIKEARRCFDIPYKFDAVFSSLMLHQSVKPERVFESIRQVLKGDGKAIIVDLCEHGFEGFKTEMGDVHLGFKLEEIAKMAGNAFAEVRVEKMRGICCEYSSRSAEIFFAYLYGVLG